MYVAQTEQEMIMWHSNTSQNVSVTCYVHQLPDGSEDLPQTKTS